MVEIQLAKSSSTVLVQRLLIDKNRFFAFDTQILLSDIVWIEKNHSQTGGPTVE